MVSLSGIALAVWLWLGSAWAWKVTPAALLHGRPPAWRRTWVGRYVRVEGEALRKMPSGLADGPTVWVRGPGEFGNEIEIRVGDEGAAMARSSWRGRVVRRKGPAVDATRARLDARGWIAVVIGLWGAAILCVSVVPRPRARRRAAPPGGLGTRLDRARRSPSGGGRRAAGESAREGDDRP